MTAHYVLATLLGNVNILLKKTDKNYVLTQITT